MQEMRGDRPVPRLAYSEGKLELMSPSRFHESIKSVIGRLVEAWCVEHGMDVTPYGSWTLENATAERALEPDECYVFGDVVEPDRPDLAIEVVWTSGRLDKLDIYRALRVREVWIWKGGHIHVHCLREGAYAQTTESEVLPGLDLALLARFVEVRPMTRALREYREAIRGG